MELGECRLHIGSVGRSRETGKMRAVVLQAGSDDKCPTTWYNNPLVLKSHGKSMISIPVELFSGFWLFMVGASIGSFLNVVAYRLPMGLTLLGSSHCPKCMTTIRMCDNVPVFAWLKLRGRCRNCQLPISRRYPIVEAICGFVFLALGTADFAYGGSNLPSVSWPRYPGFAESLITPRPENLVLFLSHAVLMTLLLACTLIEFDRHAAIWRLMGLMLGCGIIAAIFAPGFPSQPTAVAPKYGAALPGVFSGLTESDLATRAYGVVVGFILGYVVSASCAPCDGGAEEKLRSGAIVWGIVGLWLGLFGILSTLIVGTVLRMLGELLRIRRNGELVLGRVLAQPIGILFVATLLHLLFWSRLARIPGWPLNGYTGIESLGWVFGACIVLLAIAQFTQTPTAFDSKSECLEL